jgi:uncharacterized protein
MTINYPPLPITMPMREITAFCEQNPIQKLSLFGSILREDFTTNSDIDMLVEFLPEAKIGYFKLVALQIDLSDILGRVVDLRTPQELSPYFRQHVIEQAVTLYER